MKQLALAFHQYIGDYDERMPHAWDSYLNTTVADNSYNSCANCIVTPNNYDPVVWPAKIEPYLKNRQVFTCPSATQKKDSPCSATPMQAAAVPIWPAGYPSVLVKAGANYWYYGASTVGYGYNTYYLGGNRYAGFGNCLNWGTTHPSLPFSNGIGVLTSELANPAGTVLLIDNYFSNLGSTNAPAFVDFPSLRTLGADGQGDFQCRANGTFDAYDSIPQRHFNGLNVAFVDGHVKWMTKDKLTYGLASEDCAGTGAASAIHFITDPNFLWNRL